MKTNNEFIYALTHQLNGKTIYFYVGRSERAIGERFAEHKRNAKTREEDVYKYIRAEVPNYDFDEEVLCWCKDENPADYEGFYVIKLLREGHNLQNMKMGDAKKIAEQQEMAASDYVFNNPSDLRKYREHKKQQQLQAKQRLKLAAARFSAQSRSQIRFKNEYTPFEVVPVARVSDDPIEQAALKKFEDGKYTQALNLLRNSHVRFLELFGITYLEAVKL